MNISHADIRIQPFGPQHYDSYQSWFADQPTAQYLGSIDRNWLDHIETDNSGKEYAFTYNDLLIAVIGIVIGVGVIVAVDLANSSARKAFLLSMDNMPDQYSAELLRLSGKKYWGEATTEPIKNGIDISSLRAFTRIGCKINVFLVRQKRC